VTALLIVIACAVGVIVSSAMTIRYARQARNWDAITARQTRTRRRSR